MEAIMLATQLSQLLHDEILGLTFFWGGGFSILERVPHTCALIFLFSNWLAHRNQLRVRKLTFRSESTSIFNGNT
jgi:hypothetical protein